MTCLPPRTPASSRSAAAVTAAALLLSACTPGPRDVATPVPVAAPAPRPAPVLTSPRPPDRQAPPPSESSLTMAQYLGGIEDALIARGLLRTGDGSDLPRPTPAGLAENFVQIALRDEYQMQNGVLVQHPHPAPLRRWAAPVRLGVEFGASVPPATRAADRASIAEFAARLSRVSGHPVGMAQSGGNFVVLIVAEDERRAIGPRLARLVPGIPASDIRSIQNMAPQNLCTVFAYSPGGSPAYTNAVAVIRAELPARLRLSCIHEELAQGMGLANDSPAVRPSIFNDDEEFALLTAHDELLLRMLYDPRLRPGMSEAEARPIAETIAAELLR